jgi:hypothetical protein
MGASQSSYPRRVMYVDQAGNRVAGPYQGGYNNGYPGAHGAAYGQPVQYADGRYPQNGYYSNGNKVVYVKERRGHSDGAAAGLGAAALCCCCLPCILD